MLKSSPVAIIVCMPFVRIDQPPLGVSILCNALRSNGIPTKALYPAIDFAEQIPLDLYDWMGENVYDRLGDYFFSSVLYGLDSHREEKMLSALEKLFSEGRWPNLSCARNVSQFKKLLPYLYASAQKLIDNSVEEVLSYRDVQVVGCSSTFLQLFSSWAFLAKLKKEKPEIVTVIGGCECEGEAALEMVLKNPFIDYSISGEGEINLPALIKGILKKNSDFLLQKRVKGQSNLEPNELPFGVYNKPKAKIIDCSQQHNNSKKELNYETFKISEHEFITADHTDFIDKISKSKFYSFFSNHLTIEFSRGCWKGQRAPCRFCGINGYRMNFRMKDTNLTISEIKHHYQAGMRFFHAMDTIIDLRKMRPVFEFFRDKCPDACVLCETISTLSEEQLIFLSDCGVLLVQPGIETLHPKHISLLNKGNSANLNICYLKFAKENHIHVFWNILTAIPGDAPKEYDEMAEIIPLLEHFSSPGISIIRYDRFSDYWLNQEKYGLKLIPMANSEYLVPTDTNLNFNRITMYFDNIATDAVTDYNSSSIKHIHSLIREWNEQENMNPVLEQIPDGRIHDTRRVATDEFYRPSEKEQLIMDFFRIPRTKDELFDFYLQKVGENNCLEYVQRLCNRKYVLYWDNHYISLVTKPINKKRELTIQRRLNCLKKIEELTKQINKKHSFNIDTIFQPK